MPFEFSQQLFDRIQPHVKERAPQLFTRFLPAGYRLTTLSSVAESSSDAVVEAKVLLGTIITLMDDLADHPRYRDDEMLARLYRIPAEIMYGLPVTEALSEFEVLVRALIAELFERVNQLGARAQVLLPFFCFELEQFFQANRYSALISELPYAANRYENRQIVSYDMGIVAAGVIDLMASPRVDLRELGLIRELLARAQVICRIMNVVSTAARERRERDVTGELVGLEAAAFLNAQNALREEVRDKLAQLKSQGDKIRSLRVDEYVQGLAQLADLHTAHEGII